MMRDDIGRSVVGKGGRDAGEPERGMAEILGLTYAEHLTIWTLRRLVARRGPCPLILRAFDAVCGVDGRQVLAILQSFLALAGTAGRRQLSVGYPGYPDLTCDERNMIALIGAAQAADRDRLAAHLLWQARAEMRADLAMAARGLAALFAAHALHFAAPGSHACARPVCLCAERDETIPPVH